MAERQRRSPIRWKWYVGGAADGFNPMFHFCPTTDSLAELVAPELQRRGLTRKEYPMGTLHEPTRCPDPANRFSGK